MVSRHSLRGSLGAARCSIMNNENLIWDVLVHLPTKSLMRFKCVSKLWYSIIRNPIFAKAHGDRGGSGFHRLLITNFSDGSIFKSDPPRFFYANLNDCPRLMHRQLTIHQQGYSNFTTIVNGLIGLYDNGDNYFTLCNIATHEFINLPPSPSLIDSAYSDIDIYNTDYYFLGFDPVEEVFKVLNLCLSYDEEDNLMGNINCYIFTLGVNSSDMKWRNLMFPLDTDFEFHQCMCINGALYWLEAEFDKTLIRFQLDNETFQVIRIPECIDYAQLAEICASPALVYIDSDSNCDQILVVWTWNSHCGGDELEAWTRKTVLSPYLNHDYWTLNYAGTLPTGEMILVQPVFGFPLQVYIYDHRKTKLKSITIDGYESEESEVNMDEMKICHFEENIISLECLMSKSTAGSDNRHKLKMEA